MAKKSIYTAMSQQNQSIISKSDVMVNITDIVADKSTQARLELDQEVISNYAQAMKSGTVFPPVIIFNDGKNYFLADGFHRLEASKLNKSKYIKCDVRSGTNRDAILFAVGANADHGLQRKSVDKQNAVRMLLSDPEWQTWSNSVIGSKAKVSGEMVRYIRNEMVEKELIPEIRTRKAIRNGKEYAPVFKEKISNGYIERKESQEPVKEVKNRKVNLNLYLEVSNDTNLKNFKRNLKNLINNYSNEVMEVRFK